MDNMKMFSVPLFGAISEIERYRGILARPCFPSPYLGLSLKSDKYCAAAPGILLFSVPLFGAISEILSLQVRLS